MSDTIKDFIESSDNANDYNDSRTVLLEQQALEDIDNLFTSNLERDDELWSLLEVDNQTVVADYSAIEIDDRDLNWTLGLAGISAAATTQFFLDNRQQTIINPVAYREQVLEGFSLSRGQLVIAGKRGVELSQTAGFQALRADVLNELSFLKDMSNSELYNALLERNALRSFDDVLADQMQYVSRMTNLPPNSPQFNEAVADLVSSDSKRGIQQMNRRAVERIHTEREADGSLKTLLVWITEGGPTTCSYCLDRGGEVRTYGQWIESGLPGAEVCKGGDRCRCQLAAV